MAYRAYVIANEEFKKMEKERVTQQIAAKKGKKKKDSKKKGQDASSIEVHEDAEPDKTG